MGRIAELGPAIQNLESSMIRSLNKKSMTALLGMALIVFGGVGLLLAQRTTAPRVLRVNPDGSYLGIEMEDVTADSMARYKLAGETGVIVRSVVKGSPAEAARLQENDVILEYAGIPVFSMAELSRLVSETPPNRTLTLVVSRDGKKLNLTIKTGERQGDALSGRLEVLPRDLERQFNLNPPGSEFFQFRTPDGRNRSFSFVLPGQGSARLGATVEPLTEQMASFLGVPGKQGVLVNSVTAGSPASPVLRAGDVIVAVDGKAVASPADLSQALSRKEPGSKIDLKVIRDKKEISISVDLQKPGATGRGVKV